jgi:hypothetical protein
MSIATSTKRNGNKATQQAVSSSSPTSRTPDCLWRTTAGEISYRTESTKLLIALFDLPIGIVAAVVLVGCCPLPWVNSVHPYRLRWFYKSSPLWRSSDSPFVPHLPSGDQTPAHSESCRSLLLSFTFIVVPVRLLSQCQDKNESLHEAACS